MALRAPVVRYGIFCRRGTPRRNAGTRRPPLEFAKIVVDGQWWQRIRLSPGIECWRPLFSRHAHALFCFLIKGIQRLVGEWPVVANAIQRTKREVFWRVARRDATPMHGESSNRHAWGKPPRVAERVLVVEMVFFPGTLTVGQVARTRLRTIRERRRRAPGLDHGNLSRSGFG